MVLAMLQKKGLWERVWMGLTGESSEDDGEDEEDDDDDDGEDGLPQPLPLPIVPGIAREGRR
jgi:hypothetical protein